MGSSDAIIGRLISNIIQPTVNLMFALAMLYFFWGIFKMIKGADTPAELDTGKKHLLYGTIGLFIMFGAEGIMAVIKSTFNL